MTKPAFKIAVALALVIGRVIYGVRGSEPVGEGDLVILVAWLVPMATVLLTWAIAPNADPARIADAIWALGRQQEDSAGSHIPRVGEPLEALLETEEHASTETSPPDPGDHEDRGAAIAAASRARLEAGIRSAIDMAFGAIGVIGIMGGMVLAPCGLMVMTTRLGEGMAIFGWSFAGIAMGAIALRSRVRLRARVGL